MCIRDSPNTAVFSCQQISVQLYHPVNRSQYSCIFLSTDPCTAVSSCQQIPVQLYHHVIRSLYSCIILSTNPCTAVSSCQQIRASARPAYADFLQANASLVPVKNEVTSTKYRLKLSTAKTVLLAGDTLYTGSRSKWKLRLNKIASGVDQQAKP